MTVAHEITKWIYLGNGVTTSFAFTSRIFEDTDLVVSLKVVATGAVVPQVLGTHYTVNNNFPAAGGGVEMVTAVPSTHWIFIRRVLSATQNTDIRNQGAFLPEVHEDVFDRVTMLVQETNEKLTRVPMIPATTLVTSVALPEPEDDKYLQWQDGNLVNVDGMAGATDFGPTDVDDAQVGFWTDRIAGTKIWRFADRVFVDRGVLSSGNFDGLQTSGMGAVEWLEREASLFSLSSTGRFGVVGASRTTHLNDTAGAVSNWAAIGVAGAVYNDLTGANAYTAWAGYFEANRVDGALNAMGVEINAGNITGGAFTANPYASLSGTGSAFGLWIAAGGSFLPTGYAGDSATAITIVNNLKKWTRGIVFQANSLTGSDGVTGNAVAIQLAKGHEIAWHYSTGADHIGGKIRSDVTSNVMRSLVTFTDTGFEVRATADGTAGSGEVVNFLVRSAGNAANYFSVVPAALTGSPELQAIGADNTIDVALKPKGIAGLVRFGYNSAAAGTPGNFAANNIIQIRTEDGATLFIPAMLAAW